MRFIDLSHDIEAGMTNYKDLPAPHICDYLTREEARALYGEGTEFQIGRIEMVGNIATYLDTPFHRYTDGEGLRAGLEGVIVRSGQQAVDVGAFAQNG